MIPTKPMTEREKKQDEENEALALYLYDNSSEITKIMPKSLLEPAIIISKILGFENVDAYAIDLIRQNIESYQQGGDTIEEDFQEYLRHFINDKDGSIIINNRK